MIKADFNSETGILDSRFEGDLYLKEVIDYIDATKNNKDYPRFLKILTDATKAEMNFSPTDLPKIVEANYASLDQYDYIIDAIVIQSPKETALSMLYRELAKHKKYRFKVFSTRDAAIKWLEQITPSNV